MTVVRPVNGYGRWSRRPSGIGRLSSVCRREGVCLEVAVVGGHHRGGDRESLASWNVPELLCRNAGPGEVDPHDTVEDTSDLLLAGGAGCGEGGVGMV
jgi:hypothetical protein